MGPGGLAEKEAKGPSQADRMISDESFQKKEHIIKSRDFNRAYKKGACRKKESLLIYYIPNNLGHSRIGFSISSRIIKLAARRNRIKRLLREAYRQRKKALKTGFDMVLVVKKNLPGAILYKDIECIFSALVKNSELLKDNV